MQANETIKMIVGHGIPLNGKVLYYNSMSHQTSIIDIKKKKHAIYERLIDEKVLLEADYSLAKTCDTSMEIDVDKFIKLLYDSRGP